MTIIGVDEHTALTLDLDAALTSVSGLGTVTILTDSGSDVLGADDEVALSELGSAGTVESDLPKFAPSDSTDGDPFAVGWRRVGSGLNQRYAMATSTAPSTRSSACINSSWIGQPTPINHLRALEPSVPCGGCWSGSPARHNRVCATVANWLAGSSRRCSRRGRWRAPMIAGAKPML